MGLRERVYEVFTDERLDPHLFLAGVLVATLVVAILLFVLVPDA